MKQLVLMVLVLSLICAASGLLMALVYEVTREPIAEARRRKKNEASSRVLPPHDNEPATTTNAVEYGGEKWTFYIATKNGKYVGAACESLSRAGYGGDIRVMVGITVDDRVHRIEVLSDHKETPGLGARIAEDEFKNRLGDKSVRETNWAVSKDGGDIDGITAATISSRAVIEAVRAAAVDVYMNNKMSVFPGEVLE